MTRKMKSFKEYVFEELKNKKYASKYLKVALEDYHKTGDLDEFLLAIRDVAEAQGSLPMLAKKTKLSKQTVYNALSENGNPTITTLDSILNSLGFRISIEYQMAG